MATDNYLRTYSDTSIPEDVLDAIELLTAQENWLLNNLGKTTASATTHEWQTDTLMTVSAGGLTVAEGADASLSALTTPSRVTNITEIIKKDFGVTRTQRKVAHYGFEDPFPYQTQKAMKDWGNHTEYELLRSTLTSGVSGTAPSMKGIRALITTNVTAHNSGTVFSETILQGLLQLIFTNGSGAFADTLLVGANLKKKISGFVSGSTKYIDAFEKKLVNSVAVYESDFGLQQIVLHRYVTVSGDATAEIDILTKDTWKIAYLDRPHIDPLAKLGDSDRASLVGELTLEGRQEALNVEATGFNKTL